MKQNLNIGDILVHSFGGGCRDYYQIYEKTECFIKVFLLKTKLSKINIKQQTCIETPLKNQFDNGCDYSYFKLRIHDNGRIGPIKRLEGWYVYKGTNNLSFCS